jgi:hypothetical protein
VDTVLLHRVYYTLVVIEHGTRRTARASLALLEVETSIYSSDVYTLPMGGHSCSSHRNFQIMHQK